MTSSRAITAEAEDVRLRWSAVGSDSVADTATPVVVADGAVGTERVGPRHPEVDAFVRTAFVRLALAKPALVRSALVKFAPDRLAAVKAE